MAVIYWTQADGWPSPNTTDGDTDCGTWLAITTTNGNIDTVAYTPTGAYAPKNAWRISGINLIGDLARFQYSPSYALQDYAISAVITIPNLSSGDARMDILFDGRNTISIERSDALLHARLNSDGAVALTTTNLTAYIGKPVLIEADLNMGANQTRAIRLFDYATGEAGTPLGSASTTRTTARTVSNFLFGGKKDQADGAVDPFYAFEFQLRDRAGSHVPNPYIGYPAGSEWNAAATASLDTDGVLTAADEWENYSGTSGLLVRTSGAVAPSEAGTETCVLVDSPVIAQGHISVDIAGLQSGDKAGITLARHKSQFDLSDGGSEAVDASQYDIYVTTDGATHTLVVELDGTPLDSSVASNASGTLTVYCRESGVNNRIYATFDDADPAVTDDIDTYPARWGLTMTRAAGAGATLSNWAATWQYPTTHTVYELARFCDGVLSNNMLHPCVIQSPKYNQIVIAAQIGSGTEISKDSAIWAWVVPISGMTSATDFLGPVRLDVGDGSTFRAHNPSGATHNGRAVMLWGRDDCYDYEVMQLCGAIHQGDTNFVYPDGKRLGDGGIDPTLTLGTDSDGTSLGIYRLHLKGMGFQSGDNLIMPGIRTANRQAISSIDTGTDRLTVTGHGLSTGNVVQFHTTGSLPTSSPQIAVDTDYYARVIDTNVVTIHTSEAGAIANTGLIDISEAGSGNSLEHEARGIVTLTIPITGTSFGTVAGGEVLDASTSLNEWVIYPKSDSEWWAWCRSSNPAPSVCKSEDEGATWTLQTTGYFPLQSVGDVPIDGTTLGGGEFILHGPIQTNSVAATAIRRKLITATPFSSDDSVYAAGWQFDRASELQLLFTWGNADAVAEGSTGYGQLVSTPSGDLLASYSQRSSDAPGYEKAAQIFLIQIPQSITDYTPWENPYGVVSTRMALTGVGT